MEIGDYLTNVLAINDLSSFHYKYLECPFPDSASLRTSLSSIVTKWRQLGCLVAQDANKPGIWLFGSDEGTESLLPSSAEADSSDLVEEQDISLFVRKDETYTYEAIKSLVKTLMNPATPTSATNSSLLAITAETNVKTSQSANMKAAGNNSVLGFSRESVNNGVKKEFLPLGPGADVIDHLLSAILASLTYQLCRGSGFIALNSRTLVIPNSHQLEENDHPKYSEENESPSRRTRLLTLGLDMTSIGTLIVKASISYSTYYSSTTPVEASRTIVPGISDGTLCFLAPGGKIAKFIASATNESDFELKRNEDLASEETRPQESIDVKKTIERWKRRCTTWLIQKGLSSDILEGGMWYLMEVSVPSNLMQDMAHDTQNSPGKEQLVTLPWPASLCFRPISRGSRERTIQWSEDDFDPLHRAGGWYKNRTDRDAIIIRRKKEREALEAANKVQAENDIRNLSANTYSPVALRRASVAGMVYPTPPDGVQHTVGATPSFDGNVSTPGHPNLHLSNIEAENTVLMKPETNSESKVWDSSIPKRDQQNTSTDFSNNGNDNLFGEMDEDLFGENDITDADFSFFDEPDVVQDSEDVEFADEVMDNELPIGTDEGRPLDVLQNEPVGNRDRGIDSLEGVEQHLGMIQDTDVADILSPAPNSSFNEPPEALQQPTNLSLEEAEAVQQGPPLSPELIFKRLSTAGIASRSTHGRSSGLIISTGSFDGVEFDPLFSSFHGKYGAFGRFIYPSSQKSIGPTNLSEIPLTEYLSRKRKRTLPSPDLLIQAFAFPLTPANAELAQIGSTDRESVIKVSQEKTSWSDPEDSSSTADNSPLMNAFVKRKRGLDIANSSYDDHDDVASSFQSLNMELESPRSGHDILDFLNPNFLDSDPADWSLRKFLTFPELPTTSNAFADDEYVAAAQVLGDQSIGRSFQVAGLKPQDLSLNEAESCGNNIVTKSMLAHVISASKPHFVDTVHCDLNTYLDLRGAPLLHQINRSLPPRPGPTPRTMLGDPSKQSAMFILPPPHLEVCRSESKLTVLPSALHFWETLGLGPCRGGKDVLALCMYPRIAGLRDNVHILLTHLRSAYEAGRFGTHELFPNVELADTEFSIELGGSTSNHTPDLIVSTLRERFSYLAGELATNQIELEGTTVEDKNIVVYFVYDPEKPELLLPICAGFHHMFETYQEALAEKKAAVSNELVLQLVPMSLFDTPTAIGVPPPSEYSRIAMEVYDRCVDLTSGQCIPSVILEQPLPRIIDFKQTPNPSASLLRENSCMHIAYAQSIDDRWVSTAWTDSTGMQQLTASYCLGRKGAPITRFFSDIAHEIWQTTLGIIAAKKITWRIMIVKCGVMDSSEMDFWKGLASTESTAHVSLTLLTVDTDPSLQLLPSSVTLPPNTLATQIGTYTTPVSTPQASILSPEQSGNVTTPIRDGGITNAATPGESSAELKIDADATLLDVTDQTWGAILSHRINNSNSLLLMNATLVSGYLIKRGGTGLLDVPVVVEVNLVHSDGNPRIYDAYLREILGFYRGLATVARARGVVDHVTDGRPWHIAAAEKAVRALYLLA